MVQKRIIFFLILALFSIFSQAQTPLKKVVATASIFADMATNIAGEHLEIQTIVPIGGDPHLYKPTPSDAKLVANADLVLKNGLTFEGWLNELIENSGTKAEVVLITKGIRAIESETYQNSADPHAWMDAANGIVYIENIKNALVQLDPDNKEVYEFNYGVYLQQLQELDFYIQEQIKTIPEQRRVLITSHDAFQYYGRRYGIHLESILGISTEAESQPADIARLNKVIRENKVPAVFIESTINPKLLEQLARDNKITVGGELFADSIGEKDSDAPTYYDMLKYNTDVIVRALKQEAGMEPSTTKPKETSSNLILWGLIALIFVGGFLFVIRKMNASNE